MRVHRETWEQILEIYKSKFNHAPEMGATRDSVVRQCLGLPAWSGTKQPVGRPKSSEVPSVEVDDWNDPYNSNKGTDPNGKRWVMEGGEKIYIITPEEKEQMIQDMS